jgi:hypothetical protein
MKKVSDNFGGSPEIKQPTDCLKYFSTLKMARESFF